MSRCHVRPLRRLLGASELLCQPLVVASWEPPPWGLSAAELGAKAFNLLQLPRVWCPRFVVLTSEFVARWRSLPAPRLADVADSDDLSLLRDLFDPGDDQPERPRLGAQQAAVFVRSNAVEEAGAVQRGLFESYAVPATIEAVEEAVEQLLRESDEMRVLVQVAIDGSNGWLSNERRVSQKRSHALVEGLPGRSVFGVNEKRSDPPAPLRAASSREVEQRLREVLGWANANSGSTVAVEWVWDGSRLWIVQMDEIQIDATDPSISKYLTARDPSAALHDEQAPLSHSDLATPLVPFSEVKDGVWRKLTRPHYFARLGIPTAPVHILTGDECEQVGCQMLAADLLSIHSGTWVLRTDVRSDTNVAEDMLPTSAPLRDAGEIESFLDQAIQLFREVGLRPDQWACLPAPLLEARVSSMTYSRPGADDVVVDALWGFPDGLLYFPHDQFIVRPDSIHAQVQYKPACLLAEAGEWRNVRCGSEFDWKRTLEDPELTQLAVWARRLANDLQKPIQLMCLHRLHGHAAELDVAFHYTCDVIEAPHKTIPSISRLKNVRTIRTASDLADIDLNGGIRGFSIELEAQDRRDSDLLSAIGEKASSLGIPIYFRGSLLGHAYHMLSASGAAVIHIAQDRPPANYRPYHKIVRDSIPAIISQTGSVARVRSLSVEEALPLLKEKAVEEASEVLFADDPGQLMDELADLQEVLDAIRESAGIERDDLECRIVEKRASRGGFSELLLLEATAEGVTPGLPDGLGTVEVSPYAGGWSVDLVGEEPMVPFEWLEFEFSGIPPGFGSSESRVRLCSRDGVEMRVVYTPTRIRVRVQRRTTQNPEQGHLFDVGPVAEE